jgi:hypothetical protein
MIRRFRKKPVEIEARQFTLHDASCPEFIEDWCGGKVQGSFLGGRYLQIQTLEGVMEARVGDWIIKGVKGEFYPCKPDIFQMTYEEVT